MYYVTLDFGSANSGAIINPQGQDYNNNELIYLHQRTADIHSTKQPTVFWVKRDLLEIQNIESGSINIYSCVFYEEEFANNANFIWCREQIAAKLHEIANDESWVEIKHPKMSIYRNQNSDFKSLTIEGNRRKSYSLEVVIRLFFMVVRKEAIYRLSKHNIDVNADDIQWGLTVPGLAIWHQNSTQALKEIAKEVFGNNFSMFTEPHSALIGVNTANSNSLNLDFENGRYSLVVDLGGGTADICVMRESIMEDGTQVFDEEKFTSTSHDATLSEKAGGNDIDKNFKVYFSDKLSEGTDESLGFPINWLWNTFAREEPIGVYSFEDNWHKLQFSPKINETKIYFDPGREYKLWLRRNYPSIADKSDFGEFEFDGQELRDKVFQETYRKIINSTEEILQNTQKKNIELDLVYFAGGLSLDRNLKDRLKALVKSYAPFANFKEVGEGLAIGAIQRGGNHLAVNKGKLLRQMARKTFYAAFSAKFNGSKSDFKEFLKADNRFQYYKLGIWVDDGDFEKAFSNQEVLMQIDYGIGRVSYLTPICLRFSPISQAQVFDVSPIFEGQTKLLVRVFSSNENLILFPVESPNLHKVEEFEHEFGYEWKNATIVFDPLSSNAAEGSVQFLLKDANGTIVKKCIIKNITQRGL